jgi:hypothetical protein
MSGLSPRSANHAPVLPSRAWARLWEVVVAALLGGVWGAAFARVVGRLWPLGTWGNIPVFAWVYSPAFAALLGLCGAILVPFLVGKLGLFPAEEVLAPHRRAFCFYAWPLTLAVPCLIWSALDPWWAAGALAAGVGGMVWLCRHPARVERPRRDGLLDASVFVAALALYLSTMAPSVLPGDSGEFQFVAYVLGIPHPTGYPLYLVLGKLFSLLPIGSVAYRLNLFSGVAAAGAVWMTWRAGRALGLSRVASLVGAALLMVSETFWSVATVAEKYALNAFFVSLTLWLALRWRKAHVEGRRGRGWLAAWAFCYGLSLTHHRTMILLAPAYIWLFAADRSIWRWPTLLRLGLLGIAPLSLYLILPLFSAMNPPYAYVRIDSVRSFLDLVLAESYQGSVFQGGWDALPGRVSEFVQMWARQFGPLGLVGGIAGLGWFFTRDRRVGGLLLIGVLVEAAFALNYYVPNTVVYYLPVYTWWAVCIGGAVDLVYRVLTKPDPGGWTIKGWPLGGGWLAMAQGVWTLAALVLPLALCAARWPAMDRQRAYVHLPFDHTYGQTAVHYAEPGALVVSDWLPATVLWYRLFVEEPTPPIQVAVADPLESLWAGYVEDTLQAGRSVYLARPLIGPGDRYVLSSAGPLVKVRSAPETEVPRVSTPLEVDLSGGMRLLGSDLWVTTPGPEGVLLSPKDSQVAGGSRLHVTIYWQADGVPAGDYAVTVHLVDAAGHVWL